MENKSVISIFIVLLITGSLFPVAYNVLLGNVNDTCFPIPNAILPHAYASSWSYYFNSTNNRWYNHTVSTSTVTDVFYNGTETREDHNADALAELGQLGYKLIGVYSTDFTGKNLTSITIHLARSYNVSGIFKVGVFDKTTFADRSLFNSSINSANLHNYGSGSPDYNPILGENYATYIFNKPSGFVLGVNDVIGIKSVSIVDFSVLVAHGKTNIENSNGWMAVQQDNTIDGQLQNNNPSGDGFRGTLTATDTVTVNTYVLIPFSGHTPVTNPNTANVSRQQCIDSFTLLEVSFMIALIVVILGLVVYYRSKN